jgi:CDP-diacylglycerol---glycerol-3-phosphate 3-phosphatidyltransferase
MLKRGSNLNLPNVLTTFRFLVIPIVIVLMESNRLVLNLVAAVLFLVASLTDIVDGYIARKYNIVTNMGKILDPLADKIMVLIVLVMLIPMGRVPAWVVALIVLRETAVTSLRAVAAADGVVISASPLGKFKNMFQVIFTLFLIMYHQFVIPITSGFSFLLDFRTSGMLLMWIALFLTLWSGVDYFVRFYIGSSAQSK